MFILLSLCYVFTCHAVSMESAAFSYSHGFELMFRTDELSPDFDFLGRGGGLHASSSFFWIVLRPTLDMAKGLSISAGSVDCDPSVRPDEYGLVLLPNELCIPIDEVESPHRLPPAPPKVNVGAFVGPRRDPVYGSENPPIFIPGPNPEANRSVELQAEYPVSPDREFDGNESLSERPDLST